MRVFKTKGFARFARKASLGDAALCEVIVNAERGLIDADLGGGVIKQRVARQGQGKSGGFRVMILYERGMRALFVYGFAKSERANITKDELAALRELASEILAYDKERSLKRWRQAHSSRYPAMNRTKTSRIKKYRSPLLASVHQTAKGLHDAGVMDKQTMRKFNVMCLTPVRPLTAKQIRDLRRRARASQAVFARYLNVTTGLVSQWERGAKHPRGASLKLLTLIAKNGLEAVA